MPKTPLPSSQLEAFSKLQLNAFMTTNNGKEIPWLSRLSHPCRNRHAVTKHTRATFRSAEMLWRPAKSTLCQTQSDADTLRRVQQCESSVMAKTAAGTPARRRNATSHTEATLLRDCDQRRSCGS